MPTVKGLDSQCTYICDLFLGSFTQVYKSGLFCKGLPALSLILGCTTFLLAAGLDYTICKTACTLAEASFLHTCFAFTIHLHQTDPLGSHLTMVCVHRLTHSPPITAFWEGRENIHFVTFLLPFWFVFLNIWGNMFVDRNISQQSRS